MSFLFAKNKLLYFVMKKIINFVIISHVDHGKSTLADRFLELTATVEKRKMQPQYLDSMDLEREKGITIKMQPVRMDYNSYILNLIDTPGHIDFNYEVSRSLAAVEGAVLLVDAAKGIQAQTVGNLELAKKQDLVIIPVINKIDLVQARVKEAEREISDLLQIETSNILGISAKQGTNIEQVLEAIIEQVPSPQILDTGVFRALIFDSKYDSYKGVIAFVRVFEGKIKRGDKIYLMQEEIIGEAKEVGIFKPDLLPIKELGPGEIGYIATGVKDPGKVRVGDTITNSKTAGIKPLPGYKEPKPMVFLSIYLENSDEFDDLKNALERLRLNDAALTFKPEMKEGLGRGFQCGFLGLLHAEIITERLKREFGLNLVISAPSVVCKVLTKDKKEIFIYTPSDWIDPTRIERGQELWSSLQILTPITYLGQVLDLLKSIESQHVKTDYIGDQKAELFYEVPLREIITKNFYDKLKGVSQGFASMNYEILDWREADLVKLDVLILGKKEEVFSRIVTEKESLREGRKIVEKLKENLPLQLYSVPIQAVIGGKVIARETLKAKRRDVIAPLYGGDYSRKRKLLERQKKGKKELKEKGQVRIPPDVYLKLMK